MKALLHAALPLALAAVLHAAPPQEGSLETAGRLATERDFAAALAELERAPAPARASAAGARLEAVILRGLRRFPEAADAFARAVGLAPNDGTLAFEAGQALVMAQNASAASALFRTAGALDSPQQPWARIWDYALHRIDLVRPTAVGPDGMPLSPTAQFREWLAGEEETKFSTKVARYMLGPLPNEFIDSAREAERQRLSDAGESDAGLDDLIDLCKALRCEMIGLDGFSGELQRKILGSAPADSFEFELARQRFIHLADDLRLTPTLFFHTEADESDPTACLVRIDNDDSIAHRRGLASGDALVALEGVGDACDAFLVLAPDVKPGDVWRLTVRRAGELHEIAVVVDVESFRPGQVRR